MVEVSIIIPAYNQDKYLKETLDSVISQSYKDYECIVVDDGSTDNTARIADKFCVHKNIHYHYQNNKGLAGARNAGIIRASGKYIHFLDSDDLIEEDFFNKMAERMNNSDIDILTCGWIYIDKDGKKISDKIGPVKSEDYFSDLSLGNLFPVHSAFMKRAIFEKIDKFNEDLGALEDWDLWLRAADKGLRFATIDKAFVYYRRQPESMTLNTEIMVKNLEKFIDCASKSIKGFKDHRDNTRVYQLLRILAYAEEANDDENFQIILKDMITFFDSIKYDHKFFNKLYAVIRNLKDIKAKTRLMKAIYKSSSARYRRFWKKKMLIMNIKKIIKNT